jgi:HD-GYP domain-containing protein (c-di-GMP phosphodiesterase class II)
MAAAEHPARSVRRRTLLATRCAVTSPTPQADRPVPGALRARDERSGESAERLAAALLETLLNAIDATDPQTGAHVRRVARYALILADAADLDEHAQHDVERVALFHDIGKIHEALFDVIHDHGTLSAADRRAILTHPARGVEVLSPLEAFYPTLSEGVLSHHERWDGRGYPNRLRGEAIPLSARIVALADSFDAMTHSRRYSAGRSLQEAVRLIAEGRGAQFDPTLTDLFLLPPVLEEIRGAMNEPPHQHRPVPGDRRRGRREPVPDVTFRWRSEARAPHSPATQAQTPPG